MKAQLCELVEAEPDPQKDGVVRWRCVDLRRVLVVLTSLVSAVNPRLPTRDAHYCAGSPVLWEDEFPAYKRLGGFRIDRPLGARDGAKHCVTSIPLALIARSIDHILHGRGMPAATASGADAAVVQLLCDRDHALAGLEPVESWHTPFPQPRPASKLQEARSRHPTNSDFVGTSSPPL